MQLWRQGGPVAPNVLVHQMCWRSWKDPCTDRAMRIRVCAHVTCSSFKKLWLGVTSPGLNPGRGRLLGWRSNNYSNTRSNELLNYNFPFLKKKKYYCIVVLLFPDWRKPYISVVNREQEFNQKLSSRFWCPISMKSSIIVRLEHLQPHP